MSRDVVVPPAREPGGTTALRGPAGPPAGAPAPASNDQPDASPPPSGRSFARTLGRSRIHLIWLAIVVVLVGWPIYQTVRIGLEPQGTGSSGGVTLSNYGELFTSSEILTPLRNSLVLSTLSMLFSVVIGVVMAYLAARTDMVGGKVIRAATLLAFALPNFTAALGWLLLLGPRSGLINKWGVETLGLPGPILNIMSPTGILFVMVTHYWPISFLPIYAALSNMDERLEEAAVSIGASRLTTFFRITLPLLLPAIAAGGLLVFVYVFMQFGTVAILGTPIGYDTVPTYMYRLMSFPPRLVTAAVVVIPSLIMLMVLVAIQRRITSGRQVTVIGGKPGGASKHMLGWARIPVSVAALAFFVISLVLPLAVLVLTSFRESIGRPLSFAELTLSENYRRLFDTPGVVEALRTSLWIAAAATLTSLSFAFFAAWLLERRPSPFNRLITPLMMLPTAFSGVILGVALVLAYGRPPLALTGTRKILYLAYVIQTLPLTFIYVHAGLRQLGRDLEDVARSLGAGVFTTLRRIQAPILSKTLIAAALLNFVFLFRELDVSVFLFTGSYNVVGVVLFGLASQNRYAVMGAMGTILLAISLTVVLLTTFLSERSERRRRRVAT